MALLWSSGEDLPLFSGTPVKVQAQAFTPQTYTRQLGLVRCPECGNDRPEALERQRVGESYWWHCEICSAMFQQEDTDHETTD